MRNWLPLCFAAAMIAAPAQAQYIYVDVDGDQNCTTVDFPPYDGGSIDVWLDTSKTSDGAPATCATGEELTLSSYEVVLILDGITATGWTNARPEFLQSLGFLTEGRFVYAGYSSGGSVHLPPGLYKLGALSTWSSGSGCKLVNFRAAGVFSGTTHYTQFYSECAGLDGDGATTLVQDFNDTCGTGGTCDDAEQGTTWGKIKKQYLPE